MNAKKAYEESVTQYNMRLQFILSSIYRDIECAVKNGLFVTKITNYGYSERDRQKYGKHNRYKIPKSYYRDISKELREDGYNVTLFPASEYISISWCKVGEQ